MPDGKARELTDRDGTLKLADGRTLAFAAWATAPGRRSSISTAFPGSRLEASFVPLGRLNLIARRAPGLWPLPA